MRQTILKYPGSVSWIPQVSVIFEEVSFPIYRYSKQKFFGSFLLQGTVYFGTLYGYHDTVNLGPEVADNEEGAKLASNFDLPELPRSLVGSSINSWISCYTTAKNDAFYKTFDADCCLEICSPQYFIELAKAASHRCQIAGLYNVRYGDGSELVTQYTDGRPLNEADLLLQWKRSRYAWQKEVRFCLEPWCPRPPRASIGIDRNFEDQMMKMVDDVGIQAATYSDCRNFPALKPLLLHVPAAIPFARIVERRSG